MHNAPTLMGRIYVAVLVDIRAMVEPAQVNALVFPKFQWHGQICTNSNSLFFYVFFIFNRKVFSLLNRHWALATYLKDRIKTKQSDRQADRQTDRQTGRQTDRQTDKQTDRQTERQADRQKDWQTDRQTDRQAGRQTDS